LDLYHHIVSSHAHGFKWGLNKSQFKYTLLDDPLMYRELKDKCYGGLSCTYTREFTQKINEYIFEFDATSMYPSSMCDGLPDKLIRSIEFDSNTNDGLDWYNSNFINKLFHDDYNIIDMKKIINHYNDYNHTNIGLDIDIEDIYNYDNDVDSVRISFDVYLSIRQQLINDGQLDDIEKIYYNTESIIYIKCDTSFDPNYYKILSKFPPRITKRKFDKNNNIILNDNNINNNNHNKVFVEKLTNDLYPSHNDIYEYEYLKYMVTKGLIINKIHRVDIYRCNRNIGKLFIMNLANERAKIKKINDLCNSDKINEDELSKLVNKDSEEYNFILNNPKECKCLYDIKSNQLKLTMNAFYGKTIENVENRTNNIIESNIKNVEKYMSSPLFKSINLITKSTDDDNPNQKYIYFIKNGTREIILDKPIFIGKCILDRSKLSLMKFVYDDLFRVYGIDNIDIGATDTDSIHVKIKTDLEEHINDINCLNNINDINHMNYKHDKEYYRTKIYNKFSEFNCVMDNSKIDKKNEVGNYKRDESNAGKLGSWKNEGAGDDILLAKYHKSKQYAEIFESGKENIKSKGIPRFIIKDKGKDIFFNRNNSDEINKFKSNKISKDHKKHEMIMNTITKKVWGKKEDKVETNNSGDYRPWGTKELIESAIEQNIKDSEKWFKDYLLFKNN